MVLGGFRSIPTRRVVRLDPEATASPGTVPPAAPVADIGVDDADLSGYGPHTVTFTDNSTGGPGTTEWLVNDVLLGSEPEFTYTFPTSGSNYVVRLRKGNASGNDDDAVEVTSLAAAVLTVTRWTLSPRQGVAPLTANLRLPVEGDTTEDEDRYEIAWGDGTRSVGTIGDPQGTGVGIINLSHDYPQAGTFNLIAILTPAFAVGFGDPSSYQTTVDLGSVTVSDPDPTPGTTTIPLTLHNPSSRDLVAEPVGTWVPFAESDGFLDTSTFNVLDDSNNDVPCQFYVQGRWHSTRDDAAAPIRHLFVYAAVDIPAGQCAQYKLQTDAAASGGGAMSLTDQNGEYTISDGTRRWVIDQDVIGLASARVGGVNVLSSAMAPEVTMLSGLVTLGDATSEVEVGTVGATDNLVIRIYQEVEVESDALGPIRLALRMVFHSGSPLVRFESGFENRKRCLEGGGRQPTHDFLTSLYWDFPLIAGAGSVDVQTRNGAYAVAAEETWRLHCRVREQASVVPQLDRVLQQRPEHPPQSGQTPTTLHLMSYWEGKEGAEVDHTAEQFESAVLVNGPSAGVRVAICDMPYMAPKSIEVDDGGTVRVGCFPTGVPGEDHFRGNSWRGASYGSIRVTGSLRPTGNNPVLARAWATNDVAPVEYDSVAHPSTGGAGASGYPPVIANAQAAYALNRGMAFVHDFIVEFTGTPAGSTTADLDSLYQVCASFTRPIGLQPPARIKSTEVFGGFIFQPPIPKKAALSDNNSGGDHDVDHWERRPLMLIADTNAHGQSPAQVDPTAPEYQGSDRRFFGWPSFFLTGCNREGKFWRRLWGEFIYGNTQAETVQISNLHYDLGRWYLWHGLRYGDAAFWQHGRKVCRHHRDRVRIHGVAGLGAFHGSGVGEHGMWVGHAPLSPVSSHSWIGTEAMLGITENDARSFQCLEEAADFWSIRNNKSDRGPAGYTGEGVAPRGPGWGIEGLHWIYVTLGDIPTRQTGVHDEIVAGMQRMVDVETGGTFNGITQSIVPAAFSDTGQDIDYTFQGVLLGNLSGAPGYRFTSGWMECIRFVSMAQALMSLPGFSRTSPTATHREFMDHLGRLRDWIRAESELTYPTNWPVIPANWYPPGATEYGPNPAKYVGNNKTIPHILDVFAYAHILFKGSSTYDAADYAEIKPLFRIFARNGQESDALGGGKVRPMPSSINLDEHTDPGVYNQDTGAPVANSIRLATLMESGAVSSTKYEGQNRLRRYEAAIYARVQEGDLSE